MKVFVRENVRTGEFEVINLDQMKRELKVLKVWNEVDVSGAIICIHGGAEVEAGGFIYRTEEVEQPKRAATACAAGAWAMNEFTRHYKHALVHCWKCGAEHERDVVHCPTCGVDLLPF